MIFLIIAAYYYWFDSLSEMWQMCIVGGAVKPKTLFITPDQFFILGAALGGVLLITLSVFVTARFTNFQQNMMRVMLLFLFAATWASILAPELSPADLLFFVPPLAFFLAHYFLVLRKRLFRIIMPTLIFFCLLAYPFLIIRMMPEFVVDVADAESRGSKLMVLGDDLTYYLGNEIASPFIDEYSSLKRLEGLDYFNQAAELYNIIEKSDPDVIIDEWWHLPKIFERFPAIEVKYKRHSSVEYRKVSN